MTQRSWPRRFEVLVLHDGTETTFEVSTWFDGERAVAIALAHAGAGAEALTVREIGPVDRSPEGTARPAPADLIDRGEW